jgi:beta-galactosidase/beta-glucuronidase
VAAAEPAPRLGRRVALCARRGAEFAWLSSRWAALSGDQRGLVPARVRDSRRRFGARICCRVRWSFPRRADFVNGCFIGRNDNGYAPFQLRPHGLSELRREELHCGARGRELWRRVVLRGRGHLSACVAHQDRCAAPGQMGEHGAHGCEGDSPRFRLATVVQNQGKQAQDRQGELADSGCCGKTVATAEAAAQSIAVGRLRALSLRRRRWPIPRCGLDAPNLYSAIVTVKRAARRAMPSGSVSACARRCSMRTRASFLNGKPLKIQGTCNHQDHAGVGAACPTGCSGSGWRAAEMGNNAVRTSHNMPTPEWVEACDRMGVMMMCETRQMSSNPEGLAQLEAMVKRYRNSPSIILWSIGNEEWHTAGRRWPSRARRLRRDSMVRALPRTRPHARGFGCGERRQREGRLGCARHHRLQLQPEIARRVPQEHPTRPSMDRRRRARFRRAACTRPTRCATP